MAARMLWSADGALGIGSVRMPGASRAAMPGSGGSFLTSVRLRRERFVASGVPVVCNSCSWSLRAPPGRRVRLTRATYGGTDAPETIVLVTVVGLQHRAVYRAFTRSQKHVPLWLAPYHSAAVIVTGAMHSIQASRLIFRPALQFLAGFFSSGALPARGIYAYLVNYDSAISHEVRDPGASFRGRLIITGAVASSTGHQPVDHRRVRAGVRPAADHPEPSFVVRHDQRSTARVAPSSRCSSVDCLDLYSHYCWILTDPLLPPRAATSPRFGKLHPTKDFRCFAARARRDLDLSGFFRWALSSNALISHERVQFMGPSTELFAGTPGLPRRTAVALSLPP